MTRHDGARLINIAIGRQRVGDYSDAALNVIGGLAGHTDKVLYEKIIAALLEQNPDTDESAEALAENIRREYFEAGLRADRAAILQRSQDRDDELDDILDGAPPVLPPPAAPSEPQELRSDTEWAETGLFAHAVTDLLEVRTKPIARFCGMFTPAELREVADLLLAVASEQEKLADAVSE